MTEDQILGQVAIDQALSQLTPSDAAMIRLVFQLEQPEDWGYRWPPRYDDIARYIGLKFEGTPLSEATIRYRRNAVLAMWRGERGQLRRNRR